MLPRLEILYEDNHCIAVAKPGGWPSTHFQGQTETADRAVRNYLKERFQKPGNVFLGVVHRLDRPVSGVLLFARTSKAAARLAAQFREGTIEKTYWAVVEGAGTQRTGMMDDWLTSHDGRVEVVAEDTPGARRASLHFERRAAHGALSWLEIHPRTGRKHQIRVQLASRGQPVYGDVKYGASHRFGPAIALHSRALTFMHPTRGERITLTCDVPSAWRIRFADLLREAVT